MVLEQGSVRRIVECDHNRLLLDPNVTFQAFKEVAGQVRGIPLHKGRAQALPQLVNGRLSDHHHSQMTVADIEVEGSSAVPTQRLVELEELLHMPALRIIPGQSRNLGKLGSA